MKTGMLWYDDSQGSLAEKVALAAHRFYKKHGTLPTVCFVHKSALSDSEGKPIKVKSIEVKIGKAVLQHHFWIGLEDDQTDKRAERQGAKK